MHMKIALVQNIVDRRDKQCIKSRQEDAFLNLDFLNRVLKAQMTIRAREYFGS